MSVAKLRVFHEEILQEEGIKVSELSDELQRRIRGFNLQRKKLEKNPDDEKLLIHLKKQAVKLGDDVQSFVENDYEENDDDDDNDDNDDNDDKLSKGGKTDSSKKDDKKPASSKSDDKSEKPASSKKDENEGERPAKQKASVSGRFGNSMMEKKIMSIMESRGDNRIKISDLESIIGKEADYPEQEVNNIKLRKVFLSSDYRLM